MNLHSMSRISKLINRESYQARLREHDKLYDYIYANDISDLKGCKEQAETDKDELSFQMYYGWVHNNS